VRQRYRYGRAAAWRDKRGLKFHCSRRTGRSIARLADGVVIAAVEAGLDPDRYLRRLCRRLGGPARSCRSRHHRQAADERASRPAIGGGSQSEEISAAYEQNRRMRCSHVFGSGMVYVLAGEVFWGQDRIELLRTR